MMEIRLSKRGPVMWFLGDPKNLIASLNIANPKVEIDFNSLDSTQQLKLLNDLQKGRIECDQEYKVLYKQWAESSPAVVQEEAPPTQQNEMLQKQLEAKKHIEQRRQQLLDKRDKKAKRQSALCETLTKSTFEAVRTSLKNEKDISFLKMFLQAERITKNRSSVKKYVEDKIIKESIASQKSISKKVDRAVKKQLRQTLQKETMSMRVVESEQEIVVLTPEDLIAAANE